MACYGAKKLLIEERRTLKRASASVGMIKLDRGKDPGVESHWELCIRYPIVARALRPSARSSKGILQLHTTLGGKFFKYVVVKHNFSPDAPIIFG